MSDIVGIIRHFNISICDIVTNNSNKNCKIDNNEDKVILQIAQFFSTCLVTIFPLQYMYLHNKDILHCSTGWRKFQYKLDVAMTCHVSRCEQSNFEWMRIYINKLLFIETNQIRNDDDDTDSLRFNTLTFKAKRLNVIECIINIIRVLFSIILIYNYCTILSIARVQ